MKRFFATLTLLILFACTHKDEMPKNVFPKPKMEAIMWDMLKTGEFLSNFVFYKDTSIDKVAESQKWYNKVYELHHTTKADFDRSYAYYKAHPGLMKELMDTLSKRQAPSAPVVAPVPVTVPAKDSLRAKMDSLSTLKKQKISDTIRNRRLKKAKLHPKAN